MTDKPETMKLWERLLAGVRAAVELRVVTYVGDVEVSGELAHPQVSFANAGKGKAIATSINLIEGDITTAVADAFWAPDKQAVRDFHSQQVAQGKEIVERNLRLIAECGKQLAAALVELKKVDG